MAFYQSENMRQERRVCRRGATSIEYVIVTAMLSSAALLGLHLFSPCDEHFRTVSRHLDASNASEVAGAGATQPFPPTLQTTIEDASEPSSENPFTSAGLIAMGAIGTGIIVLRSI